MKASCNERLLVGNDFIFEVTTVDSLISTGEAADDLDL
jgi:hypothetical protein